MIYYDSNIINDWNFGDDNIIKVYKHGAVCYYKITSGDTPKPVQEPCFAVVDDITQYQETEFEDVFNKADNKWYKLNNLNAYEEYGVYGSGKNITYYDGKLTIDTESTPSPSRLPQGYTEVEYIENTSTAYIDTGAYLNTSNFEVGYTFWGDRAQWGYVHQNVANGAWVTAASDYAYMGRWGSSYRVAIDSYLTSDENTIVYTQSGVTVNDTSIPKNLNLSGTDNLNASTLLFFVWYDFYRAGVEHSFNSKVKSFYLKNNGILVRDFVPAKRYIDNKYGMYDLITDTFYTSPNGNNFIGGSEVIPPPITATCEFMYSGGSWVNVGEVTGSTASLPNVPFSVNYNAKNYDANTKTLLKTSGQLVDVDAQITAGTPTVGDGYLTIASGTRATISGYQNYFNRDASNPNLTIISKQTTSGSYCHMFANRDNSYNWMYRCYNTKLTLHGRSEQGSVAVTTQPVIESVRVNSSSLATYNNYTNNTSSTYSNFQYGGTNSGKFAIFAGYGTSSGEWFAGDFYWVYMCQGTLTDEQVQQVINYNEGGGGQTEYPLEYPVKQDPPDNIVFSSMAEAEEYECPWWGMTGIISNTDYLFCETNTWLTKYAYEEVSGYLCESGNKYKKLQEYDRQLDGTMSATTTYVKGDLIEAHSSDCPQCTVNFCGIDANGNTVTVNNGTSTLTQSNWTSPYPVNGEVGAATTTIGQYCFTNVKSTLSALTIGNTVTTIEHEAFMETSLITTLTIPSSVTQIDFWAFTRCNGLQEVIFEGTTPPTFTNQHSGVFHDYCPPVIYVPDKAVSAYRAIDGTVWTNQSWSTNIIQPISNR